MKIITLFPDDDPECPSDWDGQWKLYSFSSRHKSYKDPETFFPEGEATEELQRKLDTGLAFILSYYEHGLCQWSRRGTGPQCRWDNVDTAGLLVWEHAEADMGAKTFDERAKDADAFLRVYTDWCNGSVYGYIVEDEVTLPCGHIERQDVDSCQGFYGSDLKLMGEAIKEALAGDTDFRFEGTAKDVGEYLGLK